MDGKSLQKNDAVVVGVVGGGIVSLAWVLSPFFVTSSGPLFLAFGAVLSVWLFSGLFIGYLSEAVF